MNPIDIIKRQTGYYELFCFGTNNSDTNQNINFYIHNKERLEYFTTYFKKSAHNILTSAENQLMYLPKHMRSNISGVKKEPMPLPGQFHFNNNLVNATFSAREIECLSHLSRGWNTRDCASKMCLSTRTIEAYIDRIKFINENQLAFHEYF